MSKRLLFTLLFTIGLLLISVSGVSSEANPPTRIENEISMTVENTCMSPPDQVYLAGTESIHTNTYVDNSGTRTRINITLNLHGADLNSHTRYILRSVSHEVVEIANTGEQYFDVHVRDRVNSLDYDPNFIIDVHYTFAIINGELIEIDRVSRTECMGGN